MTEYSITLARINDLPAVLEARTRELQNRASMRASFISTAVGNLVRIILESVDNAEIPVDEGETQIFVIGHSRDDDDNCYHVGVFGHVAHISQYCDRQNAPSVSLEQTPEADVPLFEHVYHDVVAKLREVLPQAIATRYPEGNVVARWVVEHDRHPAHFRIEIAIPERMMPQVAKAKAEVSPKKIKVERAKKPAAKQKSSKRAARG